MREADKCNTCTPGSSDSGGRWTRRRTAAAQCGLEPNHTETGTRAGAAPRPRRCQAGRSGISAAALGPGSFRANKRVRLPRRPASSVELKLRIVVTFRVTAAFYFSSSLG